MSTDAPQHAQDCPLAAVDRRLQDLHRQWHQAEEAYFDPEGFRLAVQSAIQTLRTVTFILQKQKHVIPDFDRWYSDWQQRLNANPLMRWMRDARNKIEKEGDLEAHSFVRAEIVASYLDEGPRIEVPAQLFDPIRKLVESIPESAVGEHMRKHGTLRIERRWVENTLPDHELLDAIAVAYGRLSELVREAHQQMGLETPVSVNIHTGERFDEGSRRGRLPCMIGHSDRRSLNLSLADGHPVQLEQKQRKIDLNSAKQSAERYAIPPEKMFGPRGSDEETIAANLFETARTVFLKDGYHQSFFFLLRDRRVVRIFVHRPEDQAQKYLMMRNLAQQVIIYGADAVIALGEVWSAPADPLKPYQRPADSPSRSELLMGTLVRKDGAPIQRVALIERDGGAVSLGETHIERDPIIFLFAPIYKAWGRPVPADWLKRMAELFDEDS